MLYALTLQWHWVPFLYGVSVPGQISAIIFGALWLIAATVTYRQAVTLPNFVAAFIVLYAVSASHYGFLAQTSALMREMCLSNGNSFSV